MEIELQKSEIIALWNAINDAERVGVSGALEFTYALARTRRWLQDDVDAIQELKRDFDERRRDLVERDAARDESGKMIERGDGYLIDPAKRRAHTIDVERLHDELREIMRAPVSVRVFQVSWNHAPRELLVALVDGLFPIFLEAEPPAFAANGTGTGQPKEESSCLK